MLRVTEGTVKSIIGRLKGHGYITVDKTGVRVTLEGSLEFHRRLKEMGIESIRDLPHEELSIGPSSVAILIRGMLRRETLGLEERDQAVRAGALGAVTIVYGNGVYTMPGVYGNLEIEAPKWYKAISNIFKPEGESCIVVVFGENRWIAAEAALSVALKLKRREVFYE